MPEWRIRREVEGSLSGERGRDESARERRQARILAMQTLCQGDVQGAMRDDELVSFLTDVEADTSIRGFAMNIIRHVWSNQVLIDGYISRSSAHWDLSRISPVERNAMRAAVAELLLDTAPPAVVLNEAIEIAREYGGLDSPRFVNGVLHQVLAEIRPEGRAAQ